MSSIGAKRFFDEMAALLQKTVNVVTTTNKRYVGNLTGFDPATLSLVLTDAKDEEGKTLPKLFINGSTVVQFSAVEKPLDLRKLAERLERVFPRLVRLYEDVGVIVVMDKIRLNENGVIEGTGPAADRARKVYDEFLKEVAVK
ncbi:MAG: Lsm family RNA-binding protein [Candidatus Bathyarchaeia archaeon]